MSTLPFVSVVIAVKNGERFLGDALGSIEAQTHQDFEIIVVDDHSTDNTAAIARSFSNIRCLTPEGAGAANAYNHGVSAARGRWIAFLDHDDIWLPNKLAVQLSYMISQPHLLFTMTRVKIFLEPGDTPPPGFRPQWLEGDHAGVLSTFVGRREVFDIVGPFDTRFANAGDMDWFARANDRKVPKATLPDILVKKRAHCANLTGNVERNNQELLRLIGAKIRRARSTE